MAETKISDLTLLTASELDATNDVFPIVDISADQTKSMKIAELEVGLYQGGDRDPSFNDASAVTFTVTNDMSANGTGDIFSTLNSGIISNTNTLSNLGNSFVTITDDQDITSAKVFDENVGFNNHVSIGQNGGADIESASIGNNSLAALEVHNVVGTTSIYASNDIVAFSDISVKDNIRPIPHAIQKVKRLNGRLYTRKDSEDKEKIHMGLIAQEVEQVIPEVVKDLPEGKKAVAYQNIIGLLIEAIKDQQKQIDNLSKQIK